MNKLNGNILVGAPHSKARLNNAKNICMRCFFDLAELAKPIKWQISNEKFCEVCEESREKLGPNNTIMSNIQEVG